MRPVKVNVPLIEKKIAPPAEPAPEPIPGAPIFALKSMERWKLDVAPEPRPIWEPPTISPYFASHHNNNNNNNKRLNNKTSMDKMKTYCCDSWIWAKTIGRNSDTSSNRSTWSNNWQIAEYHLYILKKKCVRKKTLTRERERERDENI